MRRALVILLCAAGVGCATKHTIRMEPMQIKPIHVTMDVNVRVESESAEGEDDGEAAPEPHEN